MNYYTAQGALFAHKYVAKLGVHVALQLYSTARLDPVSLISDKIFTPIGNDVTRKNNKYY